MPQLPAYDPTDVLDDLRGTYLSQLLVAATTEFDVGAALESGPLSYEKLREHLGLQPRAATVLLTALRAMDLIEVNDVNLVKLSPMGCEKLAPNSSFNLRGYIGLGAFSADVQQMIACLKQDRPVGEISFVYHADGGPSALDDPPTSDALTRAMAARARNVAPYVAQQLQLDDCQHLIDCGGGHGIYSLELLRKHPHLTATILDREPPLKVAAEYASEANLQERVSFALTDIHTHQCSSPPDVVLLANILHDYNTADATRLVQHYANQLRPGGRMVILDAFLDSTLPGAPPISTGPRPVAAYSAMLFSICEGRCYRLDEYQQMMTEAGLELDPNVPAVPAHGKLLTGFKR